MKKILLLLVAVAAVGCAKKSDYLGALPKDAALVVGVRAGRLMDKGGVKELAGTNIYARVSDALEGKAGSEVLLAMLADPRESGLALDNHVYFFAIDEERLGVLAGVANKAKIDAIVTAKGGENVTYNDKTFLFHTFDKATAEALLTQKTDVDKKTAEVLAGKDDFCAVGSYDALMKLSGDMASPLKAMPQVAMMEGAQMLLTGNFEKGHMQVDLKPTFATKDAEKKYYDLMLATTGKIRGDILKYIPTNSMLVGAANINGPALYELLVQEPQIGRMAGQIPAVKSVVESLMGDVAFCVSAVEGNDVPQFTLLAELDKPDVILGYAAMAEQFGAKKVSENRYTYTLRGNTFHLGVVKNMFYATNHPESIEALDGKKIESVKGAAYGGYGALIVDVGNGRAAIEGRVDDEYKPLLSAVSKVVMSSPEVGQSHVRVIMTDKNANAAKSLFAAANASAAE